MLSDILTKIYRKRGVPKKDAKKLKDDHISTMREVWRYRRTSE
jgi:nucleotidyltransferase/DNA polymerase involved in DNA repair